MQGTRSRMSSSAQDKKSSDLIAHELQLNALIKVLDQGVSNVTDSHNPNTLEKHSNDLRQLRRLLIDCPSAHHAKNEFRRKGGFEMLLSLLRSLEGFFSDSSLSNEAVDAFFELLKCIFDVLSEALVDHVRNSNYFSATVLGGGWTSLTQLLISTGIISEQRIIRAGNLNDAVQCIGLLFSLALRDETVSGAFKTAALNHQPSHNEKLDVASKTASTGSMQLDPLSGNGEPPAETIKRAGKLVDNVLRTTDVVRFQDSFEVILVLWRKLPQSTISTAAHVQLSMILFSLLTRVCKSSAFNSVSMSRTRLGSMTMDALESFPESAEIQHVLRKFFRALVRLGLEDLNDVAQLYRLANGSSEGLDLLLESVKLSKEPSHFQFDLSLHGHASIEFADLGGPFPPQGSDAGYTFMAWLRIDRFDKSCHTTIFGAFEKTNTCFVLLYIEKDTQQLVFQTSVKSSKPSIRFKSFTFKEGIWYHVAVVHVKARTDNSSRAALIINGRLLEQLKIPFPLDPPGRSSGGFAGVSFGSENSSDPIQAFFGTPQDLSPRLGHGMLKSTLSIASGYLFSRPLEEELLLVYQKLGPYYHGNFQDCLGSFQTYRASALLNIHKERLPDIEEDRSLISKAVKSKGAECNPEINVLIGVSTASIYERNTGKQAPRLDKSIFHGESARTLDRHTQRGLNAIAFNTAIPSISLALIESSGVGILTGGTIISRTASLESGSWRLSGCVPLVLKLLESASSLASVRSAVSIFFEVTQDSWRNSEAMERENGYGVLGWLLRNKVAALSRHEDAKSHYDVQSDLNHDSSPSRLLLETVLSYMGYDISKPEDAIIINPFAYRVLLVDADIWRMTDRSTQRLYYEQFVVFCQRSRFREFNAKRLGRMRIIKKIIESFKTVTMDMETLPIALKAFKVLVQCTISADVLRSVSVFVVYAIHRDESISQKQLTIESGVTARRMTGDDKLTTFLRSPSPYDGDSKLERATSYELGVAVLRSLSDLLCSPESETSIRKFAKSVTNKWIIHLIAEPEECIVGCAFKILAKLLVVHGDPYVKKFEEKTHSFLAFSADIQSYWNSQTMWLSCLAILFGIDVSVLDFDAPLNGQDFLRILNQTDNSAVSRPSIITVILSLLEGATKYATLDLQSFDARDQAGQQPRMKEPLRSYRDSIIPAVIRLLTLLHENLQWFRDFTISSSLIRDLFKLLYRAEDKLSPLESSPAESQDPDLDPSAMNKNKQDTTPSSSEGISSNNQHPHHSQRYRPRRRGSSFVMIPTGSAPWNGNAKIIMPLKSSEAEHSPYQLTHPMSFDIVDFLCHVFLDQILFRKEFLGLGLFLKAPSSTVEGRALLNSYLFGETFTKLRMQILNQGEVFWQPTALTNVARFTTQAAEALFEGWLINGAANMVDFIGTLLDYLHSPPVRTIKSVRWSAPALMNMQVVFRRVTLFWLSTTSDSRFCTEDELHFFGRVIAWESYLLLPEGDDDLLLEALCYLLYRKISALEGSPRDQAVKLLQAIVKSRHAEILTLLTEASDIALQNLGTELVSVMHQDEADIVPWFTSHRTELEKLFSGAPEFAFAQFCMDENVSSKKNSRARMQKRKDRIDQWHLEEIANQHVWTEHDNSTKLWISNICSWEFLKHLRSKQDQQDNHNFLSSIFSKFKREIERLSIFQEPTSTIKWQLDDVEGPDRVRKRLTQYTDTSQEKYRPKRSGSNVLSIRPHLSSDMNTIATRVISDSPANDQRSGTSTPNGKSLPLSSQQASSQTIPDARDDDFELVVKPEGEEEEFDDKNRKVMRSLQRGEQVQDVCNVSRIRGLEACESLLIQGKRSLYLIENLFQRTDGEIVEASQAPKDERDPYMQSISGNEPLMNRKVVSPTEIEAQHWSWPEIISISKRHFLFRDVGLEIFFNNGQSFLLTTVSQKRRDVLYFALTDKATTIKNQSSNVFDESAWRMELLRNPRDATQTLGTKFANVFTHTSLPATKKWLKGDMSNFHYLMVINTMAGRTFNDLTQYPVFPWVLADYVSEELDLANPRSFRDLSKPMGCQTAEREAAFRERYDTYAEMADENTTSFHYGTHYSSAMIVSSYLIRLQPFVQSYLLLQGGTFDHAERLFSSIQGTWLSASKETMTDVRELIPEFFYLPDFLVNINGYDFGSKSSTGETINDVKLPPWAKGDPAIFISKHREALESPYVTQNLHSWIDLIFGFKQQGEAAIEATNVFHYLSYPGAKDLDSITDDLERDATIGIIHNFGQTPRQLFKRAHERREVSISKVKDPRSYVESLRRIPSTLFEIAEPIAGLWIAPKQQKLLCAGPFKTFLPPFYNMALEWGHTDGSVRIYASQNRRGIFEQLHQGQVTSALFADSSTLVTASEDSTVAVWTVSTSGDSFSVQPRSCLFSHKAPVCLVVVSRKYSTLLSASVDGHVVLWDLNRLELVREFRNMGKLDCAQFNDHDGSLLLCCGRMATIFTLNGSKLLQQDLCDEEDTISSCSFYQPEGTEWIESELIFTGHKRGVVNAWKIMINVEGKWELDFVRRIDHSERSRGDGFRAASAITCILSTDHSLYTGDENGKVFQWEYVR